MGGKPTTDSPITTASLIKWGSIIFTAGSLLVSVVWFAAGQRSELSGLRIQFDNLAREFRDYRASNEKRADIIETKQTTQDARLSDVSSKLDVMVSILQRVEKRLDQQPQK